MISIFYLHFNKRSVLYRETRYRGYTRVLERLYMYECARATRRDIDINRGQVRAGACFVIRAPLTSKVVNLCVNVARFEPAISDFSRGRATLFAHIPRIPTRDITRWRHPPVGRAPVVPLTKRRIMLNPIQTTDTHARSRESRRWLYLYSTDRHFFLSPNRDKRPISDKLTPPPSERCLSDREISAPSLYRVGCFKSISIISYRDIVKKKDTFKRERS